MDHKYALKYTMDFETREEGYSKEDVENTNQGLSDSVVMFSIIYPLDGSYSQLLMSFDGKSGGELSDKDLFKVWLSFGMLLKNRGKLQGWHRDIIDKVAKMTKRIFKEISNK